MDVSLRRRRRMSVGAAMFTVGALIAISAPSLSAWAAGREIGATAPVPVTTTSPSSGDGVAGLVADDSDCIRANEDGEYGDGEVSGSIRHVSDLLARYVAEHPDTTTTVGLCSDRRGIRLHVPDITDEIRDMLAGVAGTLAGGETIGAIRSDSPWGPPQAAIDAFGTSPAASDVDLASAASLRSMAVDRRGHVLVTVGLGYQPEAVDRVKNLLAAQFPDVVVDVVTTEAPVLRFTTT